MIFDKEARDKLKQGVNLVADAVKGTLGANAKKVVIYKEGEIPAVLDDGVSIVKLISHDDPYVMAGVKLMQQVAIEAQRIGGDGTTSATVLANSLINQAFEAIEGGDSPQVVSNALDNELASVKIWLEENALPYSNDKTYDIANISVNDEGLASIITEAYDALGDDGALTLAPSLTGETYFEKTDGFQMPSGYLSPMFVNAKNEVCEFTNPLVVLSDQHIKDFEQITSILEVSVRMNRPVVFICENMSGSALQNLLVNVMGGRVQACVIKCAGYGDDRWDWLQDLKAYIGGYIFTDVAMSIEHFEEGKGLVGSADRIIISKETTTIVSHSNMESDINFKIQEIESLLEECEIDFDKIKLKNRISRLKKGVGTIFIGGRTKVEQKETLERVDDAVNAVRCAIKSGYVAGGGVDLVEASFGNPMIQKASRELQRTMCDNADFPEIMYRIGSKEYYDFASGGIFNFLDSGIIDPVDVVISSLTSAVSIAKLILESNVVMVVQE